MQPAVAVLPPIGALEDAVREGGGRIAPAAEADAIVWTDVRAPRDLAAVLATSPARWVQLPFAGIESFFDAGVIDAGRTWTCTKGVYGHATAEHALALILAAARLLHRHAVDRRWHARGELAALGSGVARAPQRVAGATVLIVGTGGIGRELAAMLAPLRARVIAVNRTGTPMPGAERTEPVEAFASLLPAADYVVLAAPHTAGTERLIDADALAAMKDGAWLINVARGPLVDTDALVAELGRGRLGGAALDVTDPEPLPDDHPLWSLSDVLITSHTANTAAMALPELRAMVTRNVRAFADGRPLEGVVDPAAGY